MTHTSHRPLAILLSAALALAIWMPTLSVPAAHAAPATTIAVPALA